MKAGLTLLACVLAACSAARKHTALEPDTGAQAMRSSSAVAMPPASPPAPPPPAATPPVAPLFRSVEQQGKPDSQRIAGLGHAFSTDVQARVVVDLPNGTRVHVEPSSRVYVLELEPSALLLVAGSVFCELLPAGNLPGRTGLRVITALGTVLVTNTAELWVAQRNWPKASQARDSDALASQDYLVLLRGVAELARFTAEGALQSEPLLAGQTLPTGVLGKLRPAAATIDAARAASVEFMRKRRSPALLSGADGRLDTALLAFEQERKLGAALLSRIAPQPANGMARIPALSGDAAAQAASARARIGTGAEVRTYQRELASHAQRKHGLRAVVLLAAEQSMFVALAACDAGAVARAACPGWSEWQTRYAPRLHGAL
jgi:hypothetical protein